MRIPAGLGSLTGQPAIAGQGGTSRLVARLLQIYAEAGRQEVEERRLFLWLPVCAGAGAVLHQCATTEPSAFYLGGLTSASLILLWLVRSSIVAYRTTLAALALLIGMDASALRVARASAPVLERVQVSKLTGFLEEVDHRRAGARFILRITSAEGLEPANLPFRVRLTTPREMPFEAGAHIALTARLVPPARAALPGGYDFARDAFFARLGAVGNALGRIDLAPAAAEAELSLRLYAAIDRARNALARRVEASIGGAGGAIGAAMVTGKRDFLDDPTRETIRQAGIFHIITIAGVQMTLVAAIFFWGFRRLLALSPQLALHFPIKKWSAALAILGAIAYDIGTGSRVGTERALYMTVIMLGAVLFDRQAISMRNLALAAAAIVLFEPDALLGASFQLSFAAVAALVAVWEVRLAATTGQDSRQEMPLRPAQIDRRDRLLEWIEHTRHGPAGLLVSTLCATAATASFMAYNFHELSLYVLIGNPLTLAMIEFFAVPGALLGTLLYPLGLDGWVWTYLGLGIQLVMWLASWLAELPGATVHLREFHPGAIVFLCLGVLVAILWRSMAMRILALPLFAVGLVLAPTGMKPDLMISPAGDLLALRDTEGRLMVMGRRPNPFLVEQWLRADADGRNAREVEQALSSPAKSGQRSAAEEGHLRCDQEGCVAILPQGRLLALTLERTALAEDCARADLLITPLDAPAGCRASRVIDRSTLAETGAISMQIKPDLIAMRRARVEKENRPWSPAPRRNVARNENGAPLPRATTPREFTDDDSAETAPPFQ